jgi:hypothetical protein
VEALMSSQKAAYLERLIEAAQALPTATLGKLVDFAVDLRSREEWEATQELLCDPGMRRDVEEGHEQALRGETRSLRDIQRDV